MINYFPGPPSADTFVQFSVYGLSYRELKEDYWRFRHMTNEEFMANIISVMHFAVFTCWVKETGSGVMDDTGIIHELVHLLDPKTREDAEKRLARIRMDFNQVCELA